MNVPKRAQLVRQNSHLVFTRVELTEPADSSKTWGDVGVSHYLEDLRRERVVPFEFVSALRMYKDKSHTHVGYIFDCHMEALATTVRAIDAALNAYCQFNGLSAQAIEEMPAKGAVAIDLKTLVPRHEKQRMSAYTTLYADATKVDEVDQMCRATNPAMVFQLGQALNRIYAQAKPSSAVANPPT